MKLDIVVITEDTYDIVCDDTDLFDGNPNVLLIIEEPFNYGRERAFHLWPPHAFAYVVTTYGEKHVQFLAYRQIATLAVNP